MSSETDAEFLERMADYGGIFGFDGDDIERLRALARRGAAAEFLFGLLDDIDTADDTATRQASWVAAHWEPLW